MSDNDLAKALITIGHSVVNTLFTSGALLDIVTGPSHDDEEDDDDEFEAGIESGTYVIVRSSASGVWGGTLLVDDTTAGHRVVLREACKIWAWSGSEGKYCPSTSHIAASGLDPNKSDIAPAVTRAVVTDVIEVLEASSAGADAVRNAPAWSSER